MSRKRRLPRVLTAILPGIAVSQIISTLQIYLSNKTVFQRTADILDAGYLAVPNEHVLPKLSSVFCAFNGGLFFTLTIGAFLSLLSFTVSLGWQKSFKIKSVMLTLAVLVWIILIAAVNAAGFNPFPTAYLLFIPPLVFFISLKLQGTSDTKNHLKFKLLQLFPLVILVVIWITQFDREMFIDFRDHFLFTHKIGIAFNDFYYHYTLYPAETFKPMENKVLKTIRILGVKEKTLQRQFETHLLANDYLPLNRNAPVDLVVEQKNTRLMFYDQRHPLLDTTTKTFFDNPKEVLRTVSKNADRHRFFRRLTLISLLTGLPVFIYILIYGITRYFLSFSLNDTSASIAASVFCLVLGLAVLVPFHFMRPGHYTKADIGKLMAADSWRERVIGLKIAYQEKVDIAQFPVYKTRMKSPYIPERYWLARVIAESRDPSSYEDLKQMMDDPQINVACKVVYALGRRGDRSVIPVIRAKLTASRHWYLQNYAYAALKELGWKQAKSR